MSAIGRERFATVVRDALDEAAAHSAPGHALDTRDALLSLMRVDLAGEWERVALHFGSEEAVRRAAVADPRPVPAEKWNGTPVSATCADALTVAVRLADAYEMEFVSVGLTTVAIVADPRSAASLALTGGDPSRNAELLALLEDAIIGATLVNLDHALRESARELHGEVVEDQRQSDSRARTSPPVGPSGTYKDVLAAIGGEAQLGDTDALELLAAAVRSTADEPLIACYRRMLFDGDAIEEVRHVVFGLPTLTAADVVAQAKERFDTPAPDHRQLIVAATLRPSEQVEKAMYLLGLPPGSVAFEAATADASAHGIGTEVTDKILAYSAVNAVLAVSTSVFIVRHLVMTQNWWPDVLITIVLLLVTWNGSIIGNVVLIGALWAWVSGEAAVSAMAMTMVHLLLVRAELRNALRRTGVALTFVQWRRHRRMRLSRQARGDTAGIKWRRMLRLADVSGAGQ